ncbi:MAG TPA: VWA domain-containing protein [Candidatus Acidoferrum sp.]
MVRTPARIGFLLLAAAVFLSARAAAQQSPSNPPSSAPPIPAPNGQSNAPTNTTSLGPAIKVSVNSVLVPVVVRDSQNRAVGDLTQSDFQLFDKNKPLQITGFTVEKRAARTEEFGTDATSPPSAVTPSSAPQPTRPSSRFIVFLFDDLHIAPNDLASLKTAATKVLSETLRPGDAASVLSIFGHEDSQVTNDRERLVRAIANVKAMRSPYRLDAHACPNVDYQHGDRIENQHDENAFNVAVDETMECAHLDPIQRPMGEKLTHEAAQRAVALGEQDVRVSYIYMRELMRRMANLPGERTLILISPGFYTETPQALVFQSQVIEAAARANVTISTLDARGLYTTAPKADEALNGFAKESTERIRSHVESMTGIDAVLSGLADATGGTYIHNSNDMEGGLRRLSAAPEYVYLLEFSLDSTKPDGQYHPLKVKVDRDHVQVQNRRGYFAPSTKKLRELMASSDEVTAPIEQSAPVVVAGSADAEQRTRDVARDVAVAAPPTANPTTNPASNSAGQTATPATQSDKPAAATSPSVAPQSQDVDSDAEAAAESAATGIAPPPVEPVESEPPRSAPAPSPKKVKSKSLFWNPPSVEAESRDRTEAPECDLPAVLAQAGARATELVTNIQNFTAQERIEFRILGGVGSQYDSGSDDFDYSAVLVHHPQGYTIQEGRNPAPGSRPFPIDTHDLGLPEMALMFLPEFQRNYDMTCAGAGVWEGHLTWMINLRQRKDRPDRTASFTARNGVVYPAPLKGRAWIAQDSGEVVHLEIGLMHPILAIDIESWFLSIDYAPVHFKTRNIEIWLPQFAEAYRESETRRTITSHEFSDFRLFSVDTKQEANSPASK